MPHGNSIAKLRKFMFRSRQVSAAVAFHLKKRKFNLVQSRVFLEGYARAISRSRETSSCKQDEKERVAAASRYPPIDVKSRD